MPARTGGFGEATCQECHWENPLNDPAGQLKLDGIPEGYTAGARYLITLTLTRPDVGRAGFQLAARAGGPGPGAGASAGTVEGIDAAVQRVTAQGVVYLQHAEDGSEIRTPGSASWKFAWTAPDRGPVVFHVAANAANGDDSPLGDHIYTATVNSRPADRP
jgi:hypothetical protein